MKSNKIINNSIFGRLFDKLNYAGFILFSIIMLYPFYYCVMLAFNEGVDASKGGIYFWPRKFTIFNFTTVFRQPNMQTAIQNSILRTVIGTIVCVFFTAMFAYALSRKSLVFRRSYTVIGIIPLYFSGGLIPYYLLLKSLHLYDNFLVYIIPCMLGMYYAILFMSYFRTLPVSLEESAKLDGANDFQIFVKIILPVSKPVLAAVALFAAVFQWSSFLDTAIFTKSDSLTTLANEAVRLIRTQQVASQSLQQGLSAEGKRVTPIAVQLAIMVITVFPITVVYPFLQKYFMGGIMIGSIKG